MASIKYTNNATTTLSADINNSVTSASVADGSVFPSLSAGEHFYCTFDDDTNTEIVKVTARSSNTLTIVRAQDNTSARAFSSGDKAELRLTAVVLEEVRDNINATANNSTDETVYPVFVDGATGTQGLETDTGFTYNPSSGLLTISGELDAGSLDISGGADIDGTLEADAYTVDGTALNEYIADTVGAMVGSNTETNITVTYEDGDNTLDFVIGTLNQDTTGTAAIATSITASANNSTDETVYPVFVDGATGTQGLETDTGFTYNPSSGLLTIAGELDAGSLDVSGNADIDGTLEADAITVNGVTLAETIADTVGAMVSSNTETNITVTYEDGDNTLDFVIGTLNQDTSGTAAIATSVTASANNSTDETVYPTFVDGATGTQGIETDTGLTYNPSSGILTTTQLTGNVVGNVTGNVTGNTSGTAATVTTAAQSNITSLGTLTTLTVDNVIINGTTIGHTSDTDLMTVADGVLTVAGEVDATSLDISGDADIDGTLEADAYTVDGTALNEYIADTVGAMVGSNTESGITVAYQDGDNTLDFTVGTLNQNTTGSAATLTTARTIGGVSFDGSANITPTTFATASFSGVVTAATSAKITQVAITSSSNAVAWDSAAAANAYHVTTENTTFSAPSNAVEGAIISVELAQGGTARTIAWNTVFEFAASTAPTVTATASKTDIFSFRYNGSVWQEIGRVQNMAQT
jgi:cytoskeletal protein CcmA (bactofilin family)